jgi:hypothetical protein
MAGVRRTRRRVSIAVAAVALVAIVVVGGLVVYARRHQGNGHVVSVERSRNGRTVCAVGTAKGREIRRCGWVDEDDPQHTMAVGDCAEVGLLEEHWLARC